ncbi:MAG: hypothetical protein E7271_01615 [Lachnospiraceae bacterium]|jgi:type II secretory pathway pseudopilin PulG|nr:hypothetical protein [Lachnospiraceae bacterium]
MTRKQNKGVTIVEVVIAMAVFLVLVVPLVSSVVMSIKNTDKAKETQSRNEYAQVLMENLKSTSIADITDHRHPDKLASILTELGADGGQDTLVYNIDESTGAYTASNSSGATVMSYTPKATNDGFQITGSTFVGTQKKKYSYVVDFSDVKKESTHGVVEQLDPDITAIIPATLSNYDNVAEEALLTAKLEEEQDNNLDDVFNDSDDVSTLRGTGAERVIKVTMSGKKSDGYTVKATLTYTDKGITTRGIHAKTQEYEIYKKTFSKIPNVYIMYNPGVYNDKYTDDRFSFDINGMDEFSVSDFDNPNGINANSQKVNMFVIQTENDYSTFVKGQMTTLAADIQNNYNNYVATGTSLRRTATKAADDSIKFLSSSGKVGMAHLRVYQNVDPFITVSKVNGFNVVDVLSEAQQEVWTTYKIRIWMAEGEVSDVDTADKYITLQGTRGGGEFD